MLRRLCTHRSFYFAALGVGWLSCFGLGACSAALAPLGVDAHGAAPSVALTARDRVWVLPGTSSQATRVITESSGPIDVSVDELRRALAAVPPRQVTYVVALSDLASGSFAALGGSTSPAPIATSAQALVAQATPERYLDLANQLIENPTRFADEGFKRQLLRAGVPEGIALDPNARPLFVWGVARQLHDFAGDLIARPGAAVAPAEFKALGDKLNAWWAKLRPAGSDVWSHDQILEHARAAVEQTSATDQVDGVNAYAEAHLRPALEALGLEVATFRYKDGINSLSGLPVGNHLVATTKGGDDLPTMIFIGHLDTVYPVYSTPEEQVSFSMSRIYGSGSYDIKLGNAIGIAALQQMRAQGLFERIKPIIIFNADEERSSRNSLEFITKIIQGEMTGVSELDALKLPNRPAVGALSLEFTDNGRPIVERMGVGNVSYTPQNALDALNAAQRLSTLYSRRDLRSVNARARAYSPAPVDQTWLAGFDVQFTGDGGHSGRRTKNGPGDTTLAAVSAYKRLKRELEAKNAGIHVALRYVDGFEAGAKANIIPAGSTLRIEIYGRDGRTLEAAERDTLKADIARIIAEVGTSMRTSGASVNEATQALDESQIKTLDGSAWEGNTLGASFRYYTADDAANIEKKIDTLLGSKAAKISRGSWLRNAVTDRILKALGLFKLAITERSSADINEIRHVPTAFGVDGLGAIGHGAHTHHEWAYTISMAQVDRILAIVEQALSGTPKPAPATN